MIRITPRLLSVFNRCPRAAYLGLQSHPELFEHQDFKNPHTLIISEIIKNCYSYKMRTGSPVSWGWVKTWVDTTFRKYQNNLTYKDYTKAIEVISVLHKWFIDIYKPLGHPGGYINFPIQQPVATNHQVSIPIDVLSIEDPNRPLLIGFNESTEILRESFANSLVFSRIWAATKILGATQLSYGIITIRPQSISYKVIDLKEDFTTTACQATEDLIRRITSRIHYPIPSEQCNFCMYQSTQCIKI